MKKTNFLIVLCTITLLNLTVAQEDIFPLGEKAPNVHHTGDVWLSHLSAGDSIFDYNIAVAKFAVGAKLDWHKHPKGQQLLIIDGEGLYQERGKPIQVVHKGEVVKCQPDVEHWHAATPKSGVTYLAITGNQRTQWGEKISDEYFMNLNVDSLNQEIAKIEVVELSKNKWIWMADKNVATLEALFHDQAQFVHMGGTWGKEREVEIIRSGGIHYKKADIFETKVEVIGDLAMVWNRITLLAVVGGNEVTNPFMVTEIYKKLEGEWKLTNLSFTKLLKPN